jgi:hypothetical protein
MAASSPIKNNKNMDENMAVIDFLQSNSFNASYQITDEQQNIVAERIEKIEKGNAKFYSLEEFKEKLIKRKGV